MSDDPDYPSGDELPEHEDYYRKLRSTVEGWVEDGVSEPYIEYVLAAPDLLYTLIKLEFDPDVPKALKLKIGGAVAYFVSPVDLVPDWLFGPVGIVDDVLLAAKTLDHVMNEVGEEIVRRHWPGDEDVLSVIQTLTQLSTHWSDVSWFGKLSDLKDKWLGDGNGS